MVIEVGTFIGGSAETMLEAMPEDGVLYTIDMFTGTEGSATTSLPGEYMKQYAYQRLKPRFGDRVTILKGSSLKLVHCFEEGSADLVFIDAAHDYENCKADIQAWVPIVRSGGKLAGHDFDRRATRKVTMQDIIDRSHLEWDRETALHCGVMRAVMESFEKIDMISDENSSVWWVTI